MAEVLDPEDVEIERQEIAQISPNALAILNQSEHAAMVQTANLLNNRRKLSEFDSKLKAYANHSQPIALSMFYSLPRAGKQIIGPSVRFAEIVAPCWRNCAVGARAVGDSGSTVTAQGIFIDYEANLRNSIEVPRRITDKDGHRYSDDMIVTTINAAMSVARRNAVLKGGVPQALWTPAYDDAQLTAVGKAMSHAQRVAEAMEYLNKLGVTEWQILNSVGVPNPKELETEHLLTLRVLCQEVKRGEKTVEQVFGSHYDKEIDSLFTQLKMNDTQQRMLRTSYMARAKDLVEYLRDRLGPARSVAPAETQPAPAATESGEAVGDIVAALRGVPVEAAQSVEDRVAQASTPTFSEASGPAVVLESAAGFDFGENVTGTQAPPMVKRGRPSKADQARRTAQSAPVSSEPDTVPEQAEDEQDDKFAL